MEYSEYKNLYDRLNEVEDLQKLISEGYDERLVKTIYTQKINRQNKKRHHIVQSNSKRILRDWKKGKTIMELSRQWKFSPVMMAMILFLEDGSGRKEFWEYIDNPDLLSEEVAAEIREVKKNDILYTPEGTQEQRERGEWGESLLHEWLDGQGITYRTENDIKNVYEKTPDALLDEPMMYEGHKIYWVESKASFGDNTEFRYNARKQLIPYTEIFGPGVVVYWVGKLDDLECPPDVYIEDINVMKKKLEKIGKKDGSEESI